MSLPEEEELEPVPRWLEGHTLHLVIVHCPQAQYGLCDYSTGYFEEWDEEDEARHNFEQHWRDNH